MSECNPVYTAGTGPELSVTQPDDNLLNSEAIKLYQAIVGSCTEEHATGSKLYMPSVS